jgi:hypothetical protein
MSGADWDNRELCPDDGCIGVIGSDGTCKVCGRVAPNWGEERRRGLRTPEATEQAAEEVDTKAAAAGAASPLTGDEWDRRELCSDGACTGVIGPTGACNVCGQKRDAKRAT